MLISGTGDDGLAGNVALGVSILSFVVSAGALAYSKMQADAAKGMLRIEQGRDAEAQNSLNASRSAEVHIQEVPAGAPGVAILRLSNKGPGHARALRVELERVDDGKQVSRVALEKLARIADMQPDESLDVRFPMSSHVSRSFTLRVAWTDTKRNVLQTQIKLS